MKKNEQKSKSIIKRQDEVSWHQTEMCLGVVP